VTTRSTLIIVSAFGVNPEGLSPGYAHRVGVPLRRDALDCQTDGVLSPGYAHQLGVPLWGLQFGV